MAADSNAPQPWFVDDGYYFVNGRGFGRSARLSLRRDGAVVHKGKTLRLGPIGGPDELDTYGRGIRHVIDYGSLAEILLERSWRSGTGLVFVLLDGTAIKFSGRAMAFGSAQTLHTQVVRAARAIRPEVSSSPPVS